MLEVEFVFGSVRVFRWVNRQFFLNVHAKFIVPSRDIDRWSVSVLGRFLNWILLNQFDWGGLLHSRRFDWIEFKPSVRCVNCALFGGGLFWLNWVLHGGKSRSYALILHIVLFDILDGVLGLNIWEFFPCLDSWQHIREIQRFSCAHWRLLEWQFLSE